MDVSEAHIKQSKWNSDGTTNTDNSTTNTHSCVDFPTNTNLEQHNLKVVPNLSIDEGKTLPFPSTKKKREIFAKEQFSSIDDYAKHTPANLLTKPVEEVVEHLNKTCRTILDRVRCYFIWIATIDMDNLPDMTGEPIGNDAVLKVFRENNLSSSDHNKLFAKMCKLGDVTHHRVFGKVRTSAFSNIDNSEAVYVNDWVAVYVANEWRLVDVNFASQGVTGENCGDWELVDDNGEGFRDVHPMERKLVYHVDEFYFLTDPWEFIYSHLPNESEWQLLRRPVTKDEFHSMAFLKSTFFQNDLVLSNQPKCHLLSETGELNISLELASNTKTFTYRMWRMKVGKIPTVKECEYTNYVFMEQKREPRNALHCQVAFPVTGIYMFELFVNDIKSGSKFYTCACKYFIECSKVSNNSLTLPQNARNEWGFNQCMEELGLEPKNKNEARLYTSDGIFEMEFNCQKEVDCQIELRKEATETITLKRCVLFRENEKNKLVINGRLPEQGLYALDIFGKQKNKNCTTNDEESYPLVATYLIDCAKGISDMEYFPGIPGQKSGETKFNNKFQLKPTTLTESIAHVNKKDETVICFDKAQSVKTMSKLEFMHREVKENADQYSFQREENNQVKFCLRFVHSGTYIFSVYARESSSQRGSLLLVFRYVFFVSEANVELLSFPKMFASWRDSGCEIIDGLFDADIELGVEKDVALTIPGDREVVFLENDKVVHKLKKEISDLWTGKVKPHTKGKLTLCAQTDEEDCYAYLLQYEVKEKKTIEEERKQRIEKEMSLKTSPIAGNIPAKTMSAVSQKFQHLPSNAQWLQDELKSLQKAADGGRVRYRINDGKINLYTSSLREVQREVQMYKEFIAKVLPKINTYAMPFSPEDEASDTGKNMKGKLTTVDFPSSSNLRQHNLGAPVNLTVDKGKTSPFPSAKTKPEIFIKDQFSSIDAYAKHTPENLLTKPVEEVVEYLNKTCRTILDRVRCYFIWIATIDVANLPDLTEELKGSDTVLTVLREDPEQSCQTGYNKLFAQMCRIGDITHHRVFGKVRTSAVSNLDDSSISQGHDWVAVYVAHEWRLVDVYFAAQGVTAESYGNGEQVDDNGEHYRDVRAMEKKQIHRVREFYFLTDPWQFIHSHLPNESKWQLLQRTVTEDEFYNMACLKASFFQNDLMILNQDKYRLQLENGETNIEFQLPSDTKTFKYYLWRLKQGKDQSEKECKCNNYVFMKQDRESRPSLHCQLAIAEAGTYRFEVLVNDLHSGNNFYTLACEYVIYCSKTSNKLLALPPNERAEWGFNHDMEELGILPKNKNDAKVLASDGTFEMEFDCQNEVECHIHLRKQATTNNALNRCILFRENEDNKLVIYGRLPEQGLYALDIYGKKKYTNATADDVERYPLVATYLIDCTKGISNMEYFPRIPGQKTGETKSKNVLIPRSHPYSVVQVKGTDQLEIVFDKDPSAKFMSHLEYMCQDFKENVDQYSFQTEESNKVVFSLRLVHSGTYTFSIHALESPSDYRVFTYVFLVSEANSEWLPFPKVCAPWSSGCEIIRLVNGEIELGIEKDVAVTISDAQEVLFLQNEKVVCKLVQKWSKHWIGKVKPRSKGTMTLCARFHDKDCNTSLLQYEVKEKTTLEEEKKQRRKKEINLKDLKSKALPSLSQTVQVKEITTLEEEARAQKTISNEARPLREKEEANASTSSSQKFQNLPSSPSCSGKEPQTPQIDSAIASTNGDDPKALFIQFLQKSRGKLPPCVQKCQLKERKILLYTTGETEEFKKFLKLEEFQQFQKLFETRLTSKIETFADANRIEPPNISKLSKEMKKIRVKEDVSGGSVLISIVRNRSEDWPENEDLDKLTEYKELQRFHDAQSYIQSVVTIGLIACDPTQNIRYVVTCHHGFNDILDIPNPDLKLSFWSAYKNQSKKPVLSLGDIKPIGRLSYTENFDLIDIAFVKIPNHMLSRLLGQVRPPRIYTGEFKRLENIEVHLHGCISGPQVGKLHEPEETINLDKTGVRVFSVSGPDKNPIATHGDSGALVQGIDPTTEEPIALGLVYAGHKIDGKQLVYCSILAKAKEFYSNKVKLEWFDQ